MLHGMLLLEHYVGVISSSHQIVSRTGQSYDSPVIAFVQLGSNSTGQGLNEINSALVSKPRLSAQPCCCAMVPLTFDLLIDSRGQGSSFSTSDGMSQASITKPKEVIQCFKVAISHDGTQNGITFPPQQSLEALGIRLRIFPDNFQGKKLIIEDEAKLISCLEMQKTTPFPKQVCPRKRKNSVWRVEIVPLFYTCRLPGRKRVMYDMCGERLHNNCIDNPKAVINSKN